MAQLQSRKDFSRTPPPHTHTPCREMCGHQSHRQCPSFWYSVWTPSPQLPGNSQVDSVHSKRGRLPPPPSLTLLLSYSLAFTLLFLPLTLQLPLSSPLTPPPHVALTGFYFPTLFLSLPFYNK
ncbi:mCG1050918 [Mus musculus]|nr:mCG1050918 [Mus musculus]